MLPLLVWLPNALFVGLAVGIVFFILQVVVEPPRSRAEALFEAHKVVVVASFSLAAVAIIEVIQVAFKSGNAGLEVPIIVGITTLLVDALCGIGLFAAALLQDEKVRTSGIFDRMKAFQFSFGIFLFLIAAVVAVIFRFFESHAHSASIASLFYV